MTTWLKILLFVTGGVVAAGGTAYVTGALDPWLEPERPIIAALPSQDAISLPEGQSDQRDGAAEAAEDVALGGEDVTENGAAAESEEIVVPSFDIVRVEPDGSMVIAGHAAPGAAIEVVTGSRVVGTAKAGGAGDFAAVLDQPLSPGDYQIVLRATTQDNVVATSPETAVVSIPETPEGQVLALVEEPGAPSRLITVPEPAEPADEVDVKAEEEAPEADAVAESEPARDEEKAAELVASDEVDDPAERDAVQEEIAQTEVAAASEDVAEAETEIEEAPAEAVEEASSETEVAQAPAETTETETAMAEGPAQPIEEPMASEDEAVEQEIAALPEAEQSEPESSQPAAAEARVFVEAVEIDGDTVFVAGRAEEGRYVRVYANEIVLGETRASAGNRFLVEGKVDLPVGDYIIRADLLGGDGSVIARAAVPFEREPGETIAAVAPTASNPDEKEVAGTATADDVADAAPEADATVEADIAMADEPVEEEAPADIAERSDVGTDGAAEEEATPAEADIAMAGEAIEEEAPSAIAERSDVGTDGAAEEEVTPAEADIAMADEPVEEEAPSASAERPVVAETEEVAPEAETGLAEAQPAPESREVAAAPVEETVSPALERVDGAVIIRRGDNLWRISRRVYGHGIRYSTIYLANQDQIRNPDLIWPGQVFSVPSTTEEGDFADLEALGAQAVDPTEIPGEIIR